MAHTPKPRLRYKGETYRVLSYVSKDPRYFGPHFRVVKEDQPLLHSSLGIITNGVLGNVTWLPELEGLPDPLRPLIQIETVSFREVTRPLGCSRKGNHARGVTTISPLIHWIVGNESKERKNFDMELCHCPFCIKVARVGSEEKLRVRSLFRRHGYIPIRYGWSRTRDFARWVPFGTEFDRQGHEAPPPFPDEKTAVSLFEDILSKRVMPIQEDFLEGLRDDS